MLKAAIILLLAIPFACTQQVYGQTARKTVKPAAAQSNTPSGPIDRPLKSLAELNKLEWWKLTSFLGKDSKSTYEATKALNPQIDGSSWRYLFPYKSNPKAFQVSLSTANQHVTGLTVDVFDRGFVGGNFNSPNDDLNLALWNQFSAGKWTKMEAPELYVGEVAMLLTQEDSPEKALAKMHFFYPRSYDELSSKKLNGAAEKTNIPFGDMVFMTYDMGNGFTIGLYCAARPGNTLLSWSSSFDPSNSNSPITTVRTPFDWRRLVAYDFSFVGNDQVEAVESGTTNFKPHFTGLRNGWTEFKPNHWTDTPQQARLAEQQEMEQARIAAQQQAEQAKVIAAANQEQREEVISKTFANLSGPANGPDIITALNGKTVVPRSELGFSGTMPSSTNVYPLTTLFFPDGHERFRIETVIGLHIDASDYRTFKDGLKFRITKVVVEKDNLQIKLRSLDDPSLTPVVRMMFGKGWQTTMTNVAVLTAVDNSLAIQI